MTVSSLIAAVTVGAAVGLCGWWSARAVPMWLTVAVGVGAALLGTIVARLAGADGSRVSPAEVAAQVVAAGTAVLLVRASTRSRPEVNR